MAKAASAENDTEQFKATGVSLFNPSAIPDYMFIQETSTLVSTSHNASSTTIIAPESAAAISTENQRQPIWNKFEERQRG